VHPSAGELLSAVRASVDRVRAFLCERDFVPILEPDRLRVEAAPPFFAIQGAFCDSPGPFEPDLPTFCYATLPDPRDSEGTEAYLRDNNLFTLPIVAIHEAYPGHHVHFAHQNRHPSPVRRVFTNTAFVEGWAHYAEQAVVEAGYGEEEPRIRLFLLKNQTRSQLNAILDILLHSGEITPDVAVDFLMTRGWQEKAVARRKVERASLTSAQLSSYFVGRTELVRLRDRFCSAPGPRLPLREFHARLVRIGSPPPHCVGDLLEVAA
jgi:hypothetical protein